MATYTTFYDNQTLASKQGVNADSSGINGLGVMEYVIDFSKALFGATVIRATNADILRVFPIPLGSQILGVNWQVLTAEPATFTFNVGDTGSATRFLTGINGGVVGNGGVAVPDASLAASYYSVADTLSIAIASGVNIATAKIRVRLYGCWGTTNV